MRIYFTTIKFRIISYILGKWNVDSGRKKLSPLENKATHTYRVTESKRDLYTNKNQTSSIMKKRNCFVSESNDQSHRSISPRWKGAQKHVKSTGFLNNPFPQLYRENRRFAAGLLGQASSPFNKYAGERVSGLFTCLGSNFPTWTRNQSPRHFHPRKF